MQSEKSIRYLQRYDTIAATGHAPSVSYEALLDMNRFTYFGFKTSTFVRPEPILLYLKWVTDNIGDEPLDKYWLAGFYAERLHNLVNVTSCMTSHMLYRLPLDVAITNHYERILSAACTLVSKIGDVVYRWAPNNIYLGDSTPYRSCAKKFGHALFFFVRRIRFFEGVFRGVPALNGHPRWPARQLGFFRKEIDLVPKLLQRNDPCDLWFDANDLVFRLNEEVEQADPENEDNPGLFHGRDGEAKVLSAVRSYLQPGTVMCLRDAVEKITKEQVPDITKEQMKNFFVYGIGLPKDKV